MSAKPILFNTDMVRAILDNRKTVTRRVVTPRFCGSVFEMIMGRLYETTPEKPPRDNGDGTTTHFVRNYAPCKAPYRPGDILYVRETWCWCYCWDCGMDIEEGCCDETAEKFYNPQKEEWGCYGYKASFEENETAFDGWRPSIHMPREAARIFLRVTDVRVERLWDITEDGAKAEGAIDNRGFIRSPSNEYDVIRSAREHFAEIWNSTIKPADRAHYGWDANPWVWVIEFERISREEAQRYELVGVDADGRPGH